MMHLVLNQRGVQILFVALVQIRVHGFRLSLSAPAGSLTLFHCHIQAHMDYGFKALFRYG
jgi:hypothetical protein